MKVKTDYTKIEEKESSVLSKAEKRADEFIHKHKVHVSGNSNFFGLFVMGIMLCVSSITLPASWFALVGYVKSFGAFEASVLTGFVFSAGAFAGTMLWFWLLLKLISGNKHRIGKNTVNRLNVIAGIVLILLGLVLFGKATSTLFNIF